MIVEGWDLIPHFRWLTADGRLSINRLADARWQIRGANPADRQALSQTGFDGTLTNAQGQNASPRELALMAHQLIGSSPRIQTRQQTKYEVRGYNIVIWQIPLHARTVAPWEIMVMGRSIGVSDVYPALNAYLMKHLKEMQGPRYQTRQAALRALTKLREQYLSQHTNNAVLMHDDAESAHDR